MFTLIEGLAKTPYFQALLSITDTLELFLEQPAVYFLALAFVGASIGVARKLVPMRRR